MTARLVKVRLPEKDAVEWAKLVQGLPIPCRFPPFWFLYVDCQETPSQSEELIQIEVAVSEDQAAEWARMVSGLLIRCELGVDLCEPCIDLKDPKDEETTNDRAY